MCQRDLLPLALLLLSWRAVGSGFSSIPRVGRNGRLSVLAYPERGILVGAVIIFLSEHNSALDLSPALALSPSVDVVFIVSLVSAIILLCQPKKVSAATLMQPTEFHCILLLTEMASAMLSKR